MSGQAMAPVPCDLLVRHGVVLSLDAGRRVFPDGAVAIDGGRIAAVGPGRELEARFAAGRVIDARGGVVHPGFIDGHTHATLHLSRGCITDDPNPAPEDGKPGPGAYTRWINALDDEDEYASALMAALEMALNGFTGFVEAATAFEPDAVAAAAEAVGIRCSLADPFLWDLVGGEPSAAEIARAPADAVRAERLLGGQLRRNADPEAQVRGHVALYGMGSATEGLLKAAKACADAGGAVFHQHQSFMADDAGYDRKRFGRAPLVHLAELGLLGPNAVFTHMNLLDDDEVAAVQGSDMAIVWHPGNTMFYGIGRQAPNRMFELAHGGLSLAFGADVAKAWVYGELGYIAYLLARHEGTFLPAERVLEIFTLGGARAFGLPGELGALAPGMRADLVIHDPERADAQPSTDPVRQVALVGRTRTVDTVIVGGEIVVRGGRSTRLDEGAVGERARASARRVAERAQLSLAGRWPRVA